MCRMFGVLSTAYVAIFLLTIVHCEDVPSSGLVDFLSKGEISDINTKYCDIVLDSRTY